MGMQKIDDDKKISTRKRRLTVLNAAFGLCLLAGLLVYVDIDTILQRISGLDRHWVLISALCILTSTGIGAANLYLLVIRTRTIPGADFLPIYWTGWALSLVVPGQVGLDAVFVEVAQPVGGVACPERSRRGGVGGDGGRGQAAGVSGATTCPITHNRDGVRPAKRSGNSLSIHA